MRKIPKAWKAIGSMICFCYLLFMFNLGVAHFQFEVRNQQTGGEAGWGGLEVCRFHYHLCIHPWPKEACSPTFRHPRWVSMSTHTIYPLIGPTSAQAKENKNKLNLFGCTDLAVGSWLRPSLDTTDQTARKTPPISLQPYYDCFVLSSILSTCQAFGYS